MTYKAPNNESLFASLHILMRAIPDGPANAGHGLRRYWYRESRCQVRTGWQIRSLPTYQVGPRNLRNLWLINDLRVYNALYICRETFTDVMSALQINLFMQNKANFRKSQMNVNKVLTKDYEEKTLGERGKNKPNSNPIQSQFKPNQSQNKPNSKPNKPNFKRRIYSWTG